MEEKIKQDIHIGANIRAVRKAKKIGQTELAGLAQLEGVLITSETLAKVERGNRRIQAPRLRAAKNVLGAARGELLERQHSRGTGE